MAKKKIINDTEALKEAILSGMLDKKAVDIVVMDLKEIKNTLSDYFIICTGTSDTHVDSIAESVLDEVYLKLNENPRRKEGKKNREWILLDYLDIVVHVFKKDKHVRITRVVHKGSNSVQGSANNHPSSGKSIRN